jgi:hypothetical protein
MTCKSKFALCGGGLVFCLLMLSGCGGPALKFNNAIAGANKKMADVGMEFGKAVGEVLSGQETSLPKAKAAHEKWVKTLSDVKAEMKTLTVPSSASGKKLYETHQRFLQVQEEFSGMFGEIVRILEDKKLDAKTKQVRVQQILSQIEPKESPVLAELQNAQREFAKENNFRLEQPK